MEPAELAAGVQALQLGRAEWARDLAAQSDEEVGDCMNQRPRLWPRGFLM